MRKGEEGKTLDLLRTLEYFEVTRQVAELAGDYRREYRQKGITLSLADAVIAAVAVFYGLVLLTDNEKHYPMPEIKLQSLGS